jgi:poly(hydroxyalkanoate) depolymerase family esterase
LKLNDKLLTKMQEAAQLMRSSVPAAATAAIQRVLKNATGVAGEINSSVEMLTRVLKAFDDNAQGASARQPAADVVPDQPEAVTGATFLSASCTNHAGTRAYKLYVPGGCKGKALPLLVMLHGCAQNPDDFAAGTGMNTLAEHNNCFVVYPAQTLGSNGSNCWNWYQAGHQQRDRGEPSIIADITRDVMRKYSIDSDRVYVAGLSAGGAMAAIMGAAYPDLYAAAGIHSGMPVGAAHDAASAFAAMRSGTAHGARRSTCKESIPVIVFHGDSDTTVHPRNGEHALAQCAGDICGDPAEQQHRPDVTSEKGKVPHGRSYTRTIQRDGKGRVIAEQWLVHGAGHAWSGGSHNGSCTDPKGPDASREMLRFFSIHARRDNGRNPLD